MSLFSAFRNKAKILVIQHSEHAPGGNFCKGLADGGAELTTIAPLDGDPIPRDSAGFDGLVVFGGPQQAFDDATGPHFQSLMALMRLFDRQKKPVAGFCLGCQLLARAHGGSPWPMDALEFGFIQHHLTDEAAQDPVLGGIELPALMEFHEDTFDLPPGATLLVEGEQCRNQCFRVGNVSYGFQPHLEVDHKIVTNWINLFRGGGIATYQKYRGQFDLAFFIDLLEKLDSLLRASEQFCEKVSENWLLLTRRQYTYRKCGNRGNSHPSNKPANGLGHHGHANK